MAGWLNGIGLVCNMGGVVAIFRWGVPYYRPVEDAGKSHLLLEQDDPETETRTRSAAIKSAVGLGLLGAGFSLQLAALVV